MNEKKLFFALQLLLEGYMKKTNKGSLKETIKDFKYGVLTQNQEVLLHFYLLDEYKENGIDLIKEIEKNGETVEAGKLSNYEREVLKRKAVDLLFCLEEYELIKMNKEA